MSGIRSNRNSNTDFNINLNIVHLTIYLSVVVLVLVMVQVNIARAEDFGQRGNVTAIREEGFIAMIKRKLSQIDLQEENRKMQELAKERVANPQAVKGIKRATKIRKFHHDPTYILTEDIVLPCGKILHQAGAKVNPLEHMDFDRTLIFIDGLDKEQTSWLKEKIKFDKSNKDLLKIILVGGKPLQLEKEFGMRVYFDQMGILTDKFGIKSVPAILKQDAESKDKLLIEEIVI